MHAHTLAAHASSGTDPQCCTVVRPWCLIERERGGGLERKRKRERGITLHLANLRRAPAWRSCMKCVFPTKDFLIRPWKPRSGGRRTRSRRREEKKLSGGWTGDQSFIWGDYWTLHICANAMVISYMIVSCWQEPPGVLDFPGIKVCFPSRVCEWSVRKQETCQTDVSVTCWREFGCCGCGKVSPGTVWRMTVCFFKSSRCLNRFLDI